MLKINFHLHYSTLQMEYTILSSDSCGVGIPARQNIPHLPAQYAVSKIPSPTPKHSQHLPPIPLAEASHVSPLPPLSPTLWQQ